MSGTARRRRRLAAQQRRGLPVPFAGPWNGSFGPVGPRCVCAAWKWRWVCGLAAASWNFRRRRWERRRRCGGGETLPRTRRAAFLFRYAQVRICSIETALAGAAKRRHGIFDLAVMTYMCCCDEVNAPPCKTRASFWHLWPRRNVSRFDIARTAVTGQQREIIVF